EDGIRDFHVTGVQTCALPISRLFFSISSLERFLYVVAEFCWARVAYTLTSSACRVIRSSLTVNEDWFAGHEPTYSANPRCFTLKIGRASCRERVSFTVVGVSQ